MKSRLLALLLLVLPAPAALAIDPGTVQGSLRADGVTVPLTHAFAHLHDNAERLLRHPRELRVLLADRDVPQEALAGIGLGPLRRMAREGRVRGLLLQVDADRPRHGVVTLLRASVEPDQPLVMLRIAVAHNRVVGEIEYGGRVGFSAPLFSELPVTADLRGKAALESVQAQVLRSTQHVERIVVRGDRATAMFPDGRWLSLTRKAGEWRADD